MHSLKMPLGAKLVVFCLFFGSAAISPCVAQSAVENPVLPSLKFRRNLGNQELMGALGSKIDAVAKHHGKSESEFRALIKQDRCLCADKAAHLFYACEVPALPVMRGEVLKANTVTIKASATTISTANVATAPVLHSRAISPKKIYLDFNGHTTAGTYWNTSFASGAAFDTPPFDLDGTPDSFNATENSRMQAIWARVAEDFAPFDVDVTTEDPGEAGLSRSGSTDTTYGVRVCIGGSSYDWFAQGAGGVAYLGSFIWNTDTPCFVFTAQLGSGHEKYTAEAISHEVGHTLGLNHDGQTNITEYYAGHGNWAPIMGVGYYNAITQWSKGEYSQANNLQDDIAVMASYGATPIPDDHAGTQTTATSLTGTLVTAQGIVSTRTDTDLFRFATGAGIVNFDVLPAPLGANLDTQIALYNSAGVLMKSANLNGLATNLSATLTAGTYFLSIDGVGAGDPSTSYNDYGSLGAYTLTGTVVPMSNLPPIASTVNTTPKSGVAPLSVTCSSNGSYDPDGTISSYRWDFGDGSGISTLANPVHVYDKPGTYTASLVVTDNGGLTATSSVVINVSAAKPGIYVNAIALSVNKNSRGSTVSARITVLDSSGKTVSGARVNGAWSGVISGNVSALTNSQGVITFTSSRTTSKGTATFTVTGLSKTGFAYNPALNLESSDSITLP